jgi:hypothetical protein
MTWSHTGRFKGAISRLVARLETVAAERTGEPGTLPTVVEERES